MTVELQWSCELMTDFRQGDVVAADSDFQALQTDAGDSLLFSVDSQGALGVATESPGTATGWVRADLSAGLRADGGRVTHFAAGQNHRTGAVDVLAVVRTGARDDVYVSLGNSASDLSWLLGPAWIALPYDDDTRPRTAVVEAFVSDAADDEYLVVDVRRDPGTGPGFVYRYFLDPWYRDPARALTGRAWNANDVAVDLAVPADGELAPLPGTTSCLGRRTWDFVEGIYSLGSVAGRPVLAYQQLYDPDRVRQGLTGAPGVTLAVPPSATGLTAVRGQDDATDLYVVAGPTLYRWPADAQDDGAGPAALHSDAIFAGATQLHGFATGERVVLWGHSRSGQLFTTSCPLTSLSDPAAWTRPLPLVAHAEQISPYLNRRDGGNTFFAATGDTELTKLFQDPASGIWSTQKIVLPAPPQSTATPFTSYTTRVHVSSGGTAVPGATLALSASRRTAVTVEHLYLVLDPTPLTVTADATGTITIVEPAQGLRGTTLTLRAEDGTAVEINPMDGPMRRAGDGMGTPDRLAGDGPTVVDDRGGRRRLIPEGTPDGDRATLAQAVSGLLSAYAATPSGDSAVAEALPAAPPPGPGAGVVAMASIGVGPRVATAAAPLSPQGFADAVEVEAGDLLRWMEDTADYVVHVVRDTFQDAWHVVCEIAGKVLRFVIDVAEKAVGALLAVVAAIVKAVEDLIDFLKFVFEWEDIKRTQRVVKKLTLLSLQYGIDRIAAVKTDVREAVAGLTATLDDWAGLPPDGWGARLAGADWRVGLSAAGVGPGEVAGSPGNQVAHRLPGNVGGATPLRSAGIDPLGGQQDTVAQLVDEILTALRQEGDVFADTVDRIQAVVTEDAHPSVAVLAGRIAAIVAEAALHTVETVIDLLVDVLVILARQVIRSLDEPIWIPVVSDILEYFGITIDLSMLDIVCYAVAIPMTAVHKVALGEAPFPPGGVGDRILAAPDLTALGAPAIAAPTQLAEVPA